MCALLVQALWKLAKSGIKDAYTAVVAIASAVLSAFFKLSPILIVVICAVVTIIYKRISDKVKGDKSV